MSGGGSGSWEKADLKDGKGRRYVQLLVAQLQRADDQSATTTFEPFTCPAGLCSLSLGDTLRLECTGRSSGTRRDHLGTRHCLLVESHSVQSEWGGKGNERRRRGREDHLCEIAGPREDMRRTWDGGVTTCYGGWAVRVWSRCHRLSEPTGTESTNWQGGQEGTHRFWHISRSGGF